jgi:hypothetical protein
MKISQQSSLTDKLGWLLLLALMSVGVIVVMSMELGIS